MNGRPERRSPYLHCDLQTLANPKNTMHDRSRALHSYLQASGGGESTSRVLVEIDNFAAVYDLRGKMKITPGSVDPIRRWRRGSGLRHGRSAGITITEHRNQLARSPPLPLPPAPPRSYIPPPSMKSSLRDWACVTRLPGPTSLVSQTLPPMIEPRPIRILPRIVAPA